MDILEHAIKVEGGVSALATALGVGQSVVSMWRSRQRLPIAWQIALQLKYGKRKVLADKQPA